MISSMDLTGFNVMVRGRTLPSATKEAAYVLESERLTEVEPSVRLRDVSGGSRKAPACLFSEECEASLRAGSSRLLE